MKAFIVMGRTFKAAYDELFLCVFLSVAWWIGTILVLPAAPVTSGIHNVANRMANYKRVDNSFFWEGARSQIGRSWLLYLINLLTPLLMAVNAWFYFRLEGWPQMIGIVFVWLLVIALMIGQFVFPFFWQQDQPDIKLALRNAAVLAMRNPFYTFLLLLFQILVVGLSTAITLPLILLAPALVALAANFGVAGLLQEMGLAPEPPVVPRR
ncbi:MAG: hypothetical protein QM346_11855 [Chloroflexota bacterium]|jgi:uncharacterized membrane protein YesL|nr:hypothetical protein [Chloroflexota bacterium]